MTFQSSKNGKREAISFPTVLSIPIEIIKMWHSRMYPQNNSDENLGS